MLAFIEPIFGVCEWKAGGDPTDWMNFFIMRKLYDKSN